MPRLKPDLMRGYQSDIPDQFFYPHARFEGLGRGRKPNVIPKQQVKLSAAASRTLSNVLNGTRNRDPHPDDLPLW